MDNTVALNKPADMPEHHNNGDVAQLRDQLSTLETFIRRRFDEISMEINATSQQIDMSEDGMAKRFGEILGVMNAISFQGDGTTPANTGVELEAVITETSKAANTILDCTDAMSALLYPEDESVWENAESREQALNILRDRMQDIVLACSFQDIAGQRIRKTLENINEIETRINDALEGMGIGEETLRTAAASGESVQSGASQDEIDALFSN
ncbi:MAG: hypothetical protein DI626_02800 [Micavibrio aeruginosavorus]|uniref:Chemotaxis protein CheZ n=1 Tax=Micavibrio aeruginosavorus TaxID=349221 RepID=A0A2W5C1V6_9BACT|nr:MAG: hypothetical protein DI626_02800 [Micavibrio aeruginosavorus]